MATIGQCKACGQAVSDEAVVCPHCGQPSPCVLAPPVGTVHQGRVSKTSETFPVVEITLSSGVIAGRLLSNVLDEAERRRVRALRAGDSIKVYGDRAGQHSIRLNDQWRICFEWRDGDSYHVEIIDYHLVCKLPQLVNVEKFNMAQSKRMKKRLLEAKNRRKGIPFEEACEKLGI